MRPELRGDQGDSQGIFTGRQGGEIAKEKAEKARKYGFRSVRFPDLQSTGMV